MELQSFRDPQEYYQITMPRNTPHWNLTETAAWAVFRNLSLVERFSDPAPDHWQAYMMYDSMWLCPKVTEPSELGDALRSGRLSAMERSKDGFSLIAGALFSKPFTEKLLLKKSKHYSYPNTRTICS
jgi:hypothetical protein